MRAGRTKYTAASGIREINRAIIEFYKREFGTDYQPNEVMVTAGGKQAVFNAVVTLLNAGDEALIPKPYWVTFPEIVVFAGATPVFIETEETDFVLTLEQVERSITPRTKLLILNSPSNPSGRVLPPEQFRRIMELASERGSEIAPVHRGIVLEDICNDWMAGGLLTRAGRMDQSDVQSPGPLDIKCEFDRAVGWS